MGIAAENNPWLSAIPAFKEAREATFEMGANLVNIVINNVKTGNFYAIGGYVFDVASMFIGVGEVSAALKGTKLVGKLAEGFNAFKAATKTATLAKLGKITSTINKGLKYGDDAAKALASKLKRIPVPVMDELAIAGVGNVKVFGKGTIDDYLKLAKSNFNKDSGAVDDVAKGTTKLDGKLLRDYVRDVEARTGRKLDKSQIEKLKEALRNNEYTKLSPKETKAHRREFNKVKDSLIDEWEKNTGQSWPRYDKDIVSEKTGRITRKKGYPYDVHHMIENSFRGEHEWWNMHPAKFPNEHQAGIHGADSPAKELFK